MTDPMRDFPGFIKALPELDIPLDGVSGWLLQGEAQQVAFVQFGKDTIVPEHSHRAQWELVVVGEVVLKMDGKESIYTEGQSFYIPEGVPHSALVKGGYRSIIFFDQPDRYKAKD